MNKIKDKLFGEQQITIIIYYYQKKGKKNYKIM